MRRRIWDPVVRLCHWALVVLVALAWWTRHAGGRWHEWSGYAALTIVLGRLAWGLRGPAVGNARFAAFVRGPRATLHYARQMLAGREPRHVGHNPLGGWMIVALLGTVTAIVLTGWLYTTDRFWGEAWLDELHGALADVLLGLVTVHVCGVLYASWRHRENLVAAMMHGDKRDPEQPGRGS